MSTRRSGDLLAGVTLAALGIPEVLGYAQIAGMPVVTGLYTMLLPMVVFALLGSSRHLVVGADSATVAMMAAALAGVATPQSSRYVALAGLIAVMTGVLLLLARLIRLGFLADFLSRTVLIGFLTGVGIQIAIGQIAPMLGVPAHDHGTIATLIATVQGISHLSWPTLAVSLGVIIVVVGLRLVDRRIPGALIAVIGAIGASAWFSLSADGVAVVGPFPRGLPLPQLSALSLGDIGLVANVTIAIFVVVLAQSSATSRAYAAVYDENVDENADLVGLGCANISAALTGTFVVNGSPTKTQIVDSAGGRGRLAQITASGIVLFVLLFLTGPLELLPLAALASIVFLIGIDLVNIAGMRRILSVRRNEFVVATLTATAVVALGVDGGIAIAVVASIIDHLRTSYAPRTIVRIAVDEDRFDNVVATPQARTIGGLVIYRFTATLYYANVQRLTEYISLVVATPPPLDWLCLDCVAVGDIDFTAADALRRIHHQLANAGIRFVFTNVSPTLRAQLDRYGITDLVGSNSYFSVPRDVVLTYRQT